MPVGKKPAQVRRRKIVEEVKQKDREKTKVTRPTILPPMPKKILRVGYKNPKPREVEVPCCLDKKRPMPMVFKQCPDCPKLTEAGPAPEVVAKVTKAGSKPRRGTKKTRAGSN